MSAGEEAQTSFLHVSEGVKNVHTQVLPGFIVLLELHLSLWSLTVHLAVLRQYPGKHRCEF